MDGQCVVSPACGVKPVIPVEGGLPVHRIERDMEEEMGMETAGR